MPPQPKIHLVRHAQGFHNLGYEFHSLQDPRLTPLGQSQCEKLQTTDFPPESQRSISLVTASPLSRTLHTAYLTFAPALESGKCVPTILAIPDAQETSDFPCDTGSDVDVLHQLCADQGWPVDLSLVKEDWNIKTLANRYSPASDAIKARARDARILLRQKARELVDAGDESVEIVLVSHGGYMHYITDDWEESTKLAGTGWENCETRTYVFENGFQTDDDENAYFLETMESRGRRGKHYPMPSREEQKELFRLSMQGWEDQGLQNPSKLGLAPEIDFEGQEPAPQNMSLDRARGEIRIMA